MHLFTHHRQWNAVQDVCEKLKTSGYQALLAGGCVRDLIMGREPNDFDIASDATPDQAAVLFPNALLVGREFGVTIVPFDGFQIEIATFRIDGSYKDGRRPDTVTFSTAEEDAKRRDFTVNALFYDIETQLIIDFVQGEEDIKAKLIRAVGEPEKRFTEDKLRLLRAVRFAAQLDFKIEPATLASVRKLAKDVSLVSAERIREELTKLLKTKNAVRGFDLLIETGLISSVLPELAHKFLDPQVKKRTQARLTGAADSSERAWLNLLFDPANAMGEKSTDTIKILLRRLKFSNSESDAILWILKNQDLYVKSDGAPATSKLIRAIANPHSKLAELFFENEVSTDAKQTWRKIHTDILANARKLPDRFLNGDYLQELGVPRGRELGQILEEVFDKQLEGEIKDLDQAKTWIANRIKK